MDEEKPKAMVSQVLVDVNDMWNSIKNYFKRHFLAILIVLAIIPLVFYFCKFHSYNLSDDPADWGVFGDYIGGVYSVLIAILVVYITRNLNKRDEEKRLKKEALREVYMQITKIQMNQTVNQNKLTKLFRLIEESKLFIDDDFYDRLKKLANYLGDHGRNRQMEMDILEELKGEYADN